MVQSSTANSLLPLTTPSLDPFGEKVRLPALGLTYKGILIPDPQAIMDNLKLGAVGFNHKYGNSPGQIVGNIATETLLALHDQKLLPPGISIRLLDVKERITSEDKTTSFGSPVLNFLKRSFLGEHRAGEISRQLVWCNIDTTQFSIETAARVNDPIVTLLRFALAGKDTTAPLEAESLLPNTPRSNFEVTELSKGYRVVSIPVGPTDYGAERLEIASQSDEIRFVSTHEGRRIITTHGKNGAQAIESLLSKTGGYHAATQLDITDPSCIVIYTLKSLTEESRDAVSSQIEALTRAFLPVERAQDLTPNQITKLKAARLLGLAVKGVQENLFLRLEGELERICDEKTFPHPSDQKHFSSAKREIEELKVALSRLCSKLDQIKLKVDGAETRIDKAREEAREANRSLALAGLPLAAGLTQLPASVGYYAIAGVVAVALFRTFQYLRIGKEPLGVFSKIRSQLESTVW